MLAIIIFVGSFGPHKSTRKDTQKDWGSERERVAQMFRHQLSSVVGTCCLPWSHFPLSWSQNPDFPLHNCSSKKKKIIFVFLKHDFLGGPVVKNLSSSAADSGSNSDWGTKIPHAMGQLSLWAITTEPMGCKAPGPQLGRSPCITMQIPCEAAKTQHSISSPPKKNFKLKKKRTTLPHWWVNSRGRLA